ncbi:helix-turn-helix domain-containing protein [Gilvimarinus sp. F26214L]|uniref:helix-turn-helix domain-containing protein n=1 Tax=Gilvimarinus sp. DZF01 TaxID=3461371 RepID=UPI0040467659
MITSTQQRNAVAERIDSLRTQLDAPAKAGVPPHILEMARAQIHDHIADLSAELEEYDAACRADLHNYVFHTYDDFLKFPIVIRLSKRMSQQEFADQVGISLSQLKRYEVHAYRNAPANVVNRVLEHFSLQYSARISEAG